MNVPIAVQIEGFCDLLLHLSPVDGHVSEVGSNLCTMKRSDFQVRRLRSILTFVQTVGNFEWCRAKEVSAG